MKKISIVLTAFTVVLFAACAKKNSATSSAKAVPTNYTTDIMPLMQAKCSPCHIPSKGGKKASFETYESAKKYGAEILARVQLNPTDRGFMPMKHDKLPEAEIALIKKWNTDGLLEK